MDPHENTKNEKSPGQLQSPELQDSASQAEEPGNMKAESPRKCSICGSPNHHGCGCEAKARREGTGSGAPAAVPAAESEQPADKPPALQRDEQLEDILSAEGIIEEHEAFKNMAKDIKTMAERSDAIADCLYDACQYIRVIAGDCIAIRKILSKEDKKTEPENAPEKQN